MPSHYERLSGQDRLFLELESLDDHMHIGGCFIFDAAPLTTDAGGVDIDRIRDYVSARLSALPRYRQKLSETPVTDQPIWIDDADFQLHYHVRHTRLPVPGDERQLKRLVGRIMSDRLDRARPLWELWIVEGLARDRFALVTKVHHCIVDGVGGVELLQALLRGTPMKQPPRARGWQPRPAPPVLALGFDDIVGRVGAPLQLARNLASALRNPGEILDRSWQLAHGLARIALLESAAAGDTPLNRRRGPHRRFDWTSCELSEIKPIRRTLGGTVNDVVLTVVTGAMRRFLAMHGFSHDELEELDFRVACPVDLRGESEASPRGAGNHISMLFVSLPVGESQLDRRHEAVREELDTAKHSNQAKALRWLGDLSDWTTPRLTTAAVRHETARRASNLVVTNVRGPEIPLYLLEAEMLDAYPVVPLMPNQALAIALFSYHGRLYWGFNSDWDVVSDLHDLVGDVEQALAELRELAAHRPEAKGRPRRRRAAAHKHAKEAHS